jgi:hypothetical protein
VPNSTIQPRVVELLGSAFLEYVLNATPQDIDEYARGGRLPERSAGAAESLEVVIAHLIETADQPDQLAHLMPGWLGRHEPAAGTSVANILRRSAGGTVDVPTCSDEIEQLLAIILVDAYPLLLLKPPPWG